MTESNIKELRIFNLKYGLINESLNLNDKRHSYTTNYLKNGMYIIEMIDDQGSQTYQKLLINNK